MPDYNTRRITMVDTQVRTADVTKYPIIEAMLHVPREEFVPPGREEAAYVGENLFLAPGRVMLEPRTLAKLLEALDPRPGEKVLHVGAGLGYGPAVLARLGCAVVAVEDDAERAPLAARALAGAEPPVLLRHAPLPEGAPDQAPFDVLLIEGAVEVVPEALLAQLADGGRVGALFVEGALGTARVGRMAEGRVHWRYAFNAGAPVLPGFARAAAFVL